MGWLKAQVTRGRVSTAQDSAALAGVALAALLAVVLRVPFFFWPLTTDEGGYAYTADWWFRGLTLYSQDLWLDRPQGIFLAYKLGLQLLGGSTFSIRLWGALWAAATAAAVYLVAKELFDRRTGITASLLFALFTAAPHVEGFTANAEIFMLLPWTLSAYFLLRRQPLLAGLMGSLAFLLKPSGATIFLVAVVWLVYRRERWPEWARLVVGAIPFPLLALAHAALTVGVGAYLYDLVLYRLAPAATGPVNPVLVARASWRLTAPAWAPPAVLGLPGLVRGPRRNLVFIGAWFLASVVGMALGEKWSWHYFIQLMPALAVWGGAGLEYVWSKTPPAVSVAAAVLPLIAFLVFEGPFFTQPPKQGAWTLYSRAGYQIADEVGPYIEARTGAGDTIYVAFFEADIYYLSGRRSAFPYLYDVQLLGIPGAYDRLVATIEARKPVYVLGLDSPLTRVDPTDRLGQALQRGYQLETTFGRVPLYRRKE